MALGPGQQYRLIELGGNQGQLLVSLNSSAMYLGIGCSGISGALSINLFGAVNLPLVGMVFAMVAMVLTLTTYSNQADTAPTPAGE